MNFMGALEAIAASTEFFSFGGGERKGWERGRGARISRGKGGSREGGREGARGERCLFQEEREAQGKLFICRKNYDGDISAITFKRQRTSFAEYASSFFSRGRWIKSFISFFMGEGHPSTSGEDYF